MPSSTASSNVSVIIQVLHDIYERKHMTAPALRGDTVLDSSLGLESLDFAELVVRLEEQFGTDPFANGAPPQVRTIEDLSRLY